MSRVVIEVDGGIVVNVYLEGRGEPKNAVVIDYDVDTADKEEITEAEGYRACIHTDEITCLTPNLAHMVVRSLLETYDKKGSN